MPLGANIERIIREAQDNGAFDSLPGRGKPLPLPGSHDAVAGVLKQADALPEWLALSREIEQLREQVAAFLESYAAEYATAVEALEAASAPPAQTRGWWSRMAHGSGRGPDARERLEKLNRRREVARERLAFLLQRLQARVRQHNAVAPGHARRQAAPDLHAELAAFSSRFPRVERTAEGALRRVADPVPRQLLTPEQRPAAPVGEKRSACRNAEDLHQLLETRRTMRRF